VKVYVDHRLNGQFKIKNHPSGTADFAYRLAAPLPAGRHLVYATAFDSRGKESLWSNIVYYTAPGPRITPEAAEEGQPVATGDTGPTADPKLANLVALARLFNAGKPVDLSRGQLDELGEYIKRFEDLDVPNDDRSLLRNLYNALNNESTEPAPPASSGLVPAPDGASAGTTSLEELLEKAGEGPVETSTSGLLNESQERQSRLKWNLAIFILFLVAVIAWIFWVNRELIKEKQEQEKDSDKK
jgi:hypothetical protein